MAALHFSGAAAIGLDQALIVGDWSLRAGLSVLEQACKLAMTLFSEIVLGAKYLFGQTWEVIVKLYNLCLQFLPHVLHGECKLLGI